MNQITKTQDTLTLCLETLLSLVDELELEEDSGHACYSTRSMLKLYLYMLVKRIKGFKMLAKALHCRDELLNQFDLAQAPNNPESPFQATAAHSTRTDTRPSRGLCSEGCHARRGDEC